LHATTTIGGVSDTEAYETTGMAETLPRYCAENTAGT